MKLLFIGEAVTLAHVARPWTLACFILEMVMMYILQVKIGSIFYLMMKPGLPGIIYHAGAMKVF